MKNISELADIQLKKENQALASLLFIGFIGSACVHTAAMITPIPTLWKPVSKDDDTIEVVVDMTKTTEEQAPEITQEPEAIVKLAVIQPNEEIAPAVIALAPETQTSLKEGKDAAAPDNLKPLLSEGTSDIKIQQGGGPIIAKDGIGSGFGNAKIPTGFVLGGKINGNPNGRKDGVIGGVVNGSPNGKGPQTSTLPPATNPPIEPNEKSPAKLECLSCPKPQYRGKEGVPRVTYDIAPDGRVTNVRLRQSSGDEQTDRETLEAMSKWQFNPQTIPEGGRTDVKVRVTFQEEGSEFYRQNSERRREAERLAEQERQQREAREVIQQQNPAAIAPVNNPPSNSSSGSIDNNPVPERSPSITTTSPVIEPPSALPQPAPIVDNPPPPEPVVDVPLPESAPTLLPSPTSGK